MGELEDRIRMMRIGEKLRAKRLELHLNLEDIPRLTNNFITKSVLSGIERGMAGQPKFFVVILLAEIYKLSSAELFDIFEVESFCREHLKKEA